MPSSNPRVLLSWEPDWLHVAPIRLSEKQVTLCSDHGLRPHDKAIADALSPRGFYDLYELVLQSGLLEEGFDLVCVYASSAGVNLPFNTHRFNCPTVLLAGDTHHLSSPLTNLVSYAKSEEFSHVVSLYCKQHLHWFSAAGLKKTAWLPLLSMSEIRPPRQLERARQVAFVGHVAYHSRRYELLQQVSRCGVRLCAKQMSMNDAAELYRNSVVSLNCSLNGDLNLRVLEIIASSGFLLTDHLSDLSGIGDILIEGKHYIAYKDNKDAIELIKYYLEHPSEAENIANNAHRVFIEELRPAFRAKDLINWVTNDEIEKRFSGISDPRYHISIESSELLSSRLRIYETVQELHRTHENVRVVLSDALPSVIRKDLEDLPKVSMYSVETNHNISAVRTADSTLLDDRSSGVSHRDYVNCSNSLTIFVANDQNDDKSTYTDIALELHSLGESDQPTDSLTSYNEKIVGCEEGGSTIRLITPCDFDTDYVLHEVFESKCYATPSFIKNIEVIVDLGANIGVSAAFFRLSYQNSKIYCVEPDPRAFHFLRLNSTRIGNCNLSRLAVGREPKSVHLSASQHSTVLSTLDECSSTSRQSPVSMGNAIEFMEINSISSIDILKIDTEGCETSILIALASMLNMIRVVHLEYHSEDDRRMIDSILYDTHSLWSGNIICRHRGTLCYIRKDCISGNEVIEALTGQSN